MRKSLTILLAISICTSAMAQFCDPKGQQGQWFTTGYATVGWIVAPATIRVELLQTPLAGGTPTVAAVFDVDVVPVGTPSQPDTSGQWGLPLLGAIAASPQVEAGGIEKAYINLQWCRRMKVNAAPNTRIACRGISTAATPLPALPFMPPISAAANTWPAAPAQKFSAWSNNYDCIGCGPGAPLGLVGVHIIAWPPDWNGVLSDDEEGRFIAFTPSSIPTLSQWGLIGMAGLLLTAGVVVIRRRLKTVPA